MHILVTGGSGFLGRHVVQRALAAGHQVTLWTRRPGPATGADAITGAGVSAGASGLRRIAADLARPESVIAALAQAPPEAVVHAAALMLGARAELDAVNVEGTRTLVETLAEHGRPPRFVYVSSFAVEDTPPTPYSESKAAAEAVVRASGLPWVILRPALIYGAGDDSNTRRLVAAMRAGTQWLPAGGRTRIQPVHVEDVAAACLEAALRPQAVGRTLRLGGREPVSVRAFREAVRDASGGAARIRGLPLPVFALLARAAALLGRREALGVLAFHRSTHEVDSAEALRELDFRPRGLAEGLAATFPRPLSPAGAAPPPGPSDRADRVRG